MPAGVREAVGYALYCAERGVRHASMKTLMGFGGASVQEIRAEDSSGTYRAIYTVKFAGCLYVLHAFQKKSKEGSKTPKRDMELICERLNWAAEDFKIRSKSDEKKNEN